MDIEPKGLPGFPDKKITRRDFLRWGGFGLGGLAAAELFNRFGVVRSPGVFNRFFPTPVEAGRAGDIILKPLSENIVPLETDGMYFDISSGRYVSKGEKNEHSLLLRADELRSTGEEQYTAIPPEYFLSEDFQTFVARTKETHQREYGLSPESSAYRYSQVLSATRLVDRDTGYNYDGAVQAQKEATLMERINDGNVRCYETSIRLMTALQAAWGIPADMLVFGWKDSATNAQVFHATPIVDCDGPVVADPTWGRVLSFTDYFERIQREGANVGRTIYQPMYIDSIYSGVPHVLQQAEKPGWLGQSHIGEYEATIARNRLSQNRKARINFAASQIPGQTGPQ